MVNVLRPLEVVSGGSPVAIPHGRLTVLLASLLLSIDRPVSVETLAARMWPDHAPVQPRDVVYTCVNRLRKLLGPDLIETVPGGYRLHIDPNDVDLYQFRDLVNRARQAGSDDRERELLRAALRLWRGRPFGEVQSTWLDREVVPRLTEEWLDALERRIDLDLATKPPGNVVAELRGLTDQNPLRESLWIRLVKALHAAGLRADALIAYEKACAVLSKELGVGPGEQLAQLRRTILPGNDATRADSPSDRPASSLGVRGDQVYENVNAVDFGELLRAHRTRLGWTQAELANQSSVSERTVHGLETRRTRPRSATVRLLAEALRLNDAERARLLLVANRAAASTPVAEPAEPAVGNRAAPPTPAAQPREPAERTIPAQLPPAIRDFTGRASELAALDALLPVEGDTTVVVLTGTAGIGKTALAIRWAHRAAPSFPDGQLYANLRGFSAGQPAPPLEVLADFLGALGVPVRQIPPKQDAAAALYRSLLANRRVLVVLDNALDADQVRPLLPSGIGSVVLITSRHALGGLVVSHSALRQTLAPLSSAEASELVTRILGAERMADEPAAATLVSECSGLPLALRIAAANVRADQHLDIGEYVAELRAGDRLASLAVAGDSAASVRAAFDWSYERLSPPVQRLFRYLGLVPGPDVSAEAAAALTAADPRQARQWLRSLADAHLLDRSAPQRYALHDLLRAYAAEQAHAVDSRSDRDSAVHRLLDWYLHSTIAATKVLSPATLCLPVPPGEHGLTIPRPQDVSEAAGWLAAELRSLVAAVTYAAANGRHEAAWRIADAMRGYFEATGNRIDWETVAQAALASASADGDPAARSAAASSLAHIHHSGGDRDEAFRQATNALTLAKQAGWLAGEARALNHLAVLHAESGELDKCVELFQAALELDRRAGDRTGEARRLMNLGIATQSTGRFRESLEYLRQAVDLLGTSVHSDITLANYGHMQHHMGALDDAETTLTRAVAAHNDDTVKRAYCVATLAELCLDRGRTAEARAHADAAQAIVERTGDRDNGFWVTNTWAGIHLRLGHPQQAAERLEELLVTAGDQGYLAARCMALATLAKAQCDLGRLEQALSNADQSFELADSAGRRVLATEARLVRAGIHLARYRRDGDPDALARAAADAEQALETQRWMGGRVAEARALVVLGDISSAAGERDDAAQHWHAALTLCDQLGLADSQEIRSRLARRT